jgi:tRNA threonylcarbamoyladenosine biosynthesis protein TsaE
LSTIVLEAQTPDRMRALGSAVGKAALAGDRFLLEGPFGTGKTTFVQGLAAGLGVKTPVGSPSFVIEGQYLGRLMLYHVDLYRVERIEPELLEALEEHLYGDGVAAVEWADRLPTDLRDGGAVLRFSVLEHARRIELSTPDERLVDAIRRA